MATENVLSFRNTVFGVRVCVARLSPVIMSGLCKHCLPLSSVMSVMLGCLQGKEVATDVRLLPQGTVIFEDISIEHFEGTVAKVIPKVPSKNQVRYTMIFSPHTLYAFIIMSSF